DHAHETDADDADADHDEHLAARTVSGASISYPRGQDETQSESAKTRDMTITFHHVLDAAAFAARSHQGQLRKDKQTPYVSHVFRVCLILRDLFGFDDPRMLCAALLHDTVEDTT